MTFAEAEEYLHELQIFGIKLGLEQVSELLNGLGNPEKKLKFIHIAGTNGKGSTGAILNAALISAGFKTGFYTSPHLITVRERFRVDGIAISENDFRDFVQRVVPHIEKMKSSGNCPTYFEVTTAMAAAYFESENVDFIIWETGMGGRFDATNIVTPQCSVISGISIDHSEYLGNTVAKIAAEKSGIVKRGRPLYCGIVPPDAMEVIRKKCIESGSKLIVSAEEEPVKNLTKSSISDGQHLAIGEYEFRLSLLGKIQQENAKLAFLVLKDLTIEFDFDLSKALDGVRNMKWPGRLQVLPDGSIIDGGHNPQGVDALLEFIEENFHGKKFTVLFGCFANKNADELLKRLATVAECFVFLPLKGNRPCKSDSELLSIAASLDSEIPCSACTSVADAVLLHKGSEFLFAGSLYLAGEALSYYFPIDEIINL